MKKSNELETTLHETDLLFERFYEWLAGQYSHGFGGFYYARSSFDMPGLEPDIESTAMALNILQSSGLFDSISETMRRSLLAFFQGKQDPANGYFYDRDPNMRKDDVMVARALGYSLGSIKKLGGEPLYPPPDETGRLAEELASPETYVEWLQSVDLSSSWRGCDYLMSRNHLLWQLPEEKRRPYIQAAERYFAEIQDPETGLWGGGNGYIRISGTFKLSGFYRSFQIPLPNLDKLYASLLRILRTEEALDMCWIRNPVSLLRSLPITIPQEDLTEMIGITSRNLSRLLREDGGFSRELDHSPPAPNVAQVKEGDSYPNMPVAVPIGQGLREGDMNAATQALLIRNSCRQFAGQQPEPLRQYTGHFIHVIEEQFR